jgi:hypothetical protein
MPSPPTKYFTLEQANQAVAQIRPLIAEILRIREQVLASQSEHWPAIERSAGNGGNAVLSGVVRSFESLDRLVHRVREAGAILKDVNTGLLDFPALRGDQEVWLCWKYDEPTIQYWHELDAGFQGRQPIAGF